MSMYLPRIGVIILDGHASHVTQSIITKALRKWHTSHAMWLLDVNMLKSFETIFEYVETHGLFKMKMKGHQKLCWLMRLVDLEESINKKECEE